MPPRFFTKPLLIAAVIAALAGGFLSIYYLSAKYFISKSSRAPSVPIQQPVQPGLNELKLSTSLSASVDKKGVRPTPGLPAIPAWLPLLLFAGTLTGGWWLREWYGRTHAQQTPKLGDTRAKPQHDQVSHTLDEHRAAESSRVIEILAERDQQIVSLNAQIASMHTLHEQIDTPPDDDAPVATTDELIRLRKENESKSEIIQTLEELVSQNRENWLESDSTESAMRQEIADLNENLNAAMAIIRAQADTPAQSDTSEPGAEPASGKTASS